MATSRKHWFRVYESILKMNCDAEVGWALVRLMAWLNQRWARDGIEHDQAGRASIGPLDLALITGKRRGDVARKLLQRAAQVAGISVELLGEVALINWPNFAKDQELGTRSPGSDAPVTALSDSVSVSGSEKKREESAPSAPPNQPSKPGSLFDLPQPEEADPLAEHRQLLKLLSKRDGSPREKELWLIDHIDIMLAELDGERKKLPSLAIRWYRAYLNRPRVLRLGGYSERQFEYAARREREQQAVAAFRAANPMPPPPAEDDGPVEIPRELAACFGRLES